MEEGNDTEYVFSLEQLNDEAVMQSHIIDYLVSLTMISNNKNKIVISKKKEFSLDLSVLARNILEEVESMPSDIFVKSEMICKDNPNQYNMF